MENCCREDNHDQQQRSPTDNNREKKIKTVHVGEFLGHCSIEDWVFLYERFIYQKSPDEWKELMISIFMHFGGIHISQYKNVLSHVIDKIQQKYNMNHYHNFEHCTHVFVNSAFFLCNIGPIMTPVECIALLYAALIHDVDHLGVPNITLVKRKHPYAIRFHDQSVAEMHSLNLGFDALTSHRAIGGSTATYTASSTAKVATHTYSDHLHSKTIDLNGDDIGEYDLLSDFSENEQQLFRHYVIELVLCTDIADVYKKRVTYLKVADATDHSTNSLKVNEQAGRLALLTLLLRAADVGSSMQSTLTSHIWVHNYFFELKSASKFGDGPEFNKEIFFSNQINYMQGHSIFIIEALAKCRVLTDGLTNIMQESCEKNIKDWLIVGKKLLLEWDTSEQP